MALFEIAEALRLENMSHGFGFKINYGWWIVAVTFYCGLIFSGCIYFAFSLFVKSLQTEFGWSRSAIMAAFTFLFLVIAFASPVSGRAVDRYGPKMVMSSGALITALGFLSLVVLGSLPHYYISYIIIGLGGAAIGPVPLTSVVSDWFHMRRGLAIGIMSTGVGGGGLVLSPLVGGFIIPNFGWRAGYFSIGLLMITLVPLTIIVIKTKASDKTSVQDGLYDGRPRELQTESVTANDVTLGKALFSAAFWLIAAAFMLVQFGSVGTIQSQVPHLLDIGFPVTTATTALGGVSLVSAFSKLFFGWVCDLIKPKYAFSISVVFMAAGTSILMNIESTSPLPVFWIYVLVMGIGSGSWLPVMSMIVSTNFGLLSYGAIFGAVNLIFNIGVSVGPLFAGYIYDQTKAYHLAFVTFVILYLVSIPAMLAVRRPGLEKTET